MFSAQKKYLVNIKPRNGFTVHPTVEATKGDDLLLVFRFFDAYGNAQDLTGTTFAYSVAVEGYSSELFEVSATVSGTKALVEIDADAFESVGSYTGQLRATKDGKTSIVASGKLKLSSPIE